MKGLTFKTIAQWPGIGYTLSNGPVHLFGFSQTLTKRTIKEKETETEGEREEKERDLAYVDAV